MKAQLTHTQMRRSINDLRNEVRALRRIVDDIVRFPGDRIRQVTETVEDAFGLKRGDVYLKTKEGRIPEARYLCMAIFIKGYGMRKTHVEQMFNLGHGSADHAIIHVTDRYRLYNGFMAKCDGIFNKLCVNVEFEK